MTKLMRSIGMSAPEEDNNNVSPPIEQDDTDSGVDADFVSASTSQAQASKDVLNYMPSGTLHQLPSRKDLDMVAGKTMVNFEDLVQGLPESSVDDDSPNPVPVGVNRINDLDINHGVLSSHVNGVEHEEYALEQGVRERAAMFAKLDTNQDINVRPKNKKVDLKVTVEQSPIGSADHQLLSPRKTKRVQFAPDTEFHERENPKPKISVLDLQDRFPLDHAEGIVYICLTKKNKYLDILLE